MNDDVGFQTARSARCLKTMLLVNTYISFVPNQTIYDRIKKMPQAIKLVFRCASSFDLVHCLIFIMMVIYLFIFAFQHVATTPMGGGKCETTADCVAPNVCSKWGWCQWTKIYGEDGPSQGADAPGIQSSSDLLLRKCCKNWHLF